MTNNHDRCTDDDDNEEFFDTQHDLDDLDDDGNDNNLDNLNQSSLDLSIINNPTKERTLFAVQFIDISKVNESSLNVSRIFRDRDKAVKLCKLNADNARFKSFKYFKDAYAFSYESDQKTIQHSLQQNNNIEINTKKVIDAERLPFSQPKTRDLNELRGFIEKSFVDKFKQKILSNPRYLINSGDAPIAVQEAFHYNCLHVCAKSNQQEICAFILNTLQDVNFYKKLYVTDTIEQTHRRCERIIDLYLNTPEKGVHETPLHFACKYGSYEVAKLLINERLCSKTITNKSGKTAYELIGTKFSANTPTAIAKIEEIKSLFNDCFYVPFYRDDEKCEIIIERPIGNENLLHCSPIDRTKKLAAFVGPTSPVKASQIYEQLKSPSRDQRSSQDHKNYLNIIRSDDYKGYERVARTLSEQLNAPWLEYWEFLDTYCNLKAIDTLKKFEIYLTQKKLYQLTQYQVATCNYQIEYYKQNDELKQKYESLKDILKVKIEEFFELKENQLSKKFEKYKLNLLNLNEKLLSDSLDLYFKLVCELTACDQTSRTYFSLYKVSKLYLSLISVSGDGSGGCSGETADTYCPRFFQSRSNVINRQSLSDLLKLLNDKNNNVHNASSNDDMAKELNNSEKYFGVDSNEVDLVCSKLLVWKLTDIDEAFEINRQFKSMNINKNTIPNGNGSGGAGGSSSSKGVIQEQNPNNLTIRVFNKNISLKLQNLVIFSNTPSKVDHAVYQVLKDMYVDAEKFPLINEWYNYICKYKPNEMEKWKSPVKKKETKATVGRKMDF